MTADHGDDGRDEVLTGRDLAREVLAPDEYADYMESQRNRARPMERRAATEGHDELGYWRGIWDPTWNPWEER